MTRTAASLAILALGLAACASTAPSSAPRIASNQLPYHAGQGTVIAAAQAREPLSAAAGGTARPVTTGTAPASHRLTIRMNDGAVQYIDTDNPQISVGSRVELGADRTIRPL
jgi:hypothetical protein